MKLSELCTIFNLSLFAVWDRYKGVAGEFTICLRRDGKDVGFLDNAEDQGYDQIFGEGPTTLDAREQLADQLPGTYLFFPEHQNLTFKMPEVVTPD